MRVTALIASLLLPVAAQAALPVVATTTSAEMLLREVGGNPCVLFRSPQAEQAEAELQAALEAVKPQAVVVFAMICAMISVALPQRTTIGRVSRVILIGVALALTVLTGSRAGPVTLMLSLTGILAIRRMITYRGVAWITVAGVLLFGAMGLFLRKGAASPDASFSDNLYALVHDLEDYSLGGSVAFNSLDGDRRAIPDNGHYLRTFNEIASHLGARTEVPPLHLQYSPALKESTPLF